MFLIPTKYKVTRKTIPLADIDRDLSLITGRAAQHINATHVEELGDVLKGGQEFADCIVLTNDSPHIVVAGRHRKMAYDSYYANRPEATIPALLLDVKWNDLGDFEKAELNVLAASENIHGGLIQRPGKPEDLIFMVGQFRNGMDMTDDQIKAHFKKLGISKYRAAKAIQGHTQRVNQADLRAARDYHRLGNAWEICKKKFGLPADATFLPRKRPIDDRLQKDIDDRITALSNYFRNFSIKTIDSYLEGTLDQRRTLTVHTRIREQIARLARLGENYHRNAIEAMNGKAKRTATSL